MGGARLVARVPHTHLVPKEHGLVRVLRCDVRHNNLQERGLLRYFFFLESSNHQLPSLAGHQEPPVPHPVTFSTGVTDKFGVKALFCFF